MTAEVVTDLTPAEAERKDVWLQVPVHPPLYHPV